MANRNKKFKPPTIIEFMLHSQWLIDKFIHSQVNIENKTRQLYPFKDHKHKEQPCMATYKTQKNDKEKKNVNKVKKSKKTGNIITHKKKPEKLSDQQGSTT